MKKTPAELHLARLELQDHVDLDQLNAAYDAVRDEQRTPEQRELNREVARRAIRKELSVIRSIYFGWNNDRKDPDIRPTLIRDPVVQMKSCIAARRSYMIQLKELGA